MKFSVSLTSFLVGCVGASTVVGMNNNNMAACTSPIVAGTLPVQYGTDIRTMPVIVTGGNTNGGVTIDNNGVLTIKHNYRAYILANNNNLCPQSFTPDLYVPSFPLLNHTYSYTVDLSAVPCGCNAAMYFTLMPAINQSGLPDPTTCNDYYADANKVCGLFAPEHDSMEANNNAMQITPHQCVDPVNGFYSSCDRDGCGLNTYHLNSSSYGPGNDYTIDTTLPFIYSSSFYSNNQGLLDRIVTTLSQPNRNAQFTITHTDSNCQGSGYLEQLTYALSHGMTPILSLWGDTGATMKWLDVPPCDINISCDTNSVMKISNISLQPL